MLLLRKSDDSVPHADSSRVGRVTTPPRVGFSFSRDLGSGPAFLRALLRPGSCRCVSFFAVSCCMMAFSMVAYVWANSFHEISEAIQSLPSIVLAFVLCILGLVFVVNVIVFSARSTMPILHRAILTGCLLLTFLAIWYWDQEDTRFRFRYGFWASRGVVIIWFVLEVFVGTVSVFFWMSRHVRPWIRRTIFIMLGLVALFSAARVTITFTRRKVDFNRGLFGDGYVPGGKHSLCRIDDDAMLWSHLLPRFLIHPIAFSYWCHKEPMFTSVLTPDEEFALLTDVSSSRVADDGLSSPFDPNRITTVKLDRKRCGFASTWTVELYPRIDKRHYTYDEMKSISGGKSGMELNPATHIQTAMYSKMRTVQLSKDADYFSYDGTIYETAVVRCGKLSNLVIEPKRLPVPHPNDFFERIDPVPVDTSSQKDPAKDDGTYAAVDAGERPNVIMLFFDSVSRKSFEYDFPQSVKTIGEFMKTRADTTSFFQFYHHRIVGINTAPQTRLLWIGDQSRRKITPIWGWAKEEKYLTAYAIDECYEWATRYNTNFDIADYVHLEEMCMTEYYDHNYPIVLFSGATASARKCLFQKEAPEYVFEYLRKVETLYPDKAKFAYGAFSDAHEATGEAVRYLDRPFSEYLQWLHDSGTLDKSIVIIYADHGSHVNLISNLQRSSGLSLRINPMLYAFVPKAFIAEEGQEEIIRKNQYRMLTFSDLHVTLADLVKSAHKVKIRAETTKGSHVAYRNGINIFREEIPWERNCEDIEVTENCFRNVCDGDESKRED